jgi:hypothetical protein
VGYLLSFYSRRSGRFSSSFDHSNKSIRVGVCKTFSYKKKPIIDPLEVLIEEITADKIEDILNLPEEEAPREDTRSPEEQMLHPSPPQKPVSELPTNLEPVEISNEEEEKVEITTTDLELEQVFDPIFLTYLESAKLFLHQTLSNFRVSPRSVQKMVEAFNHYIESDDDPFLDYRIQPTGHYSWLQIRRAVTIWREMADIALRLHSSSTSEASCERMISAQKMILTAKRLNSAKKLLDARLTLMRAFFK